MHHPFISKSSTTYLSSGKAKDIYETSDGNLLFEFADRVTAFGGKKRAEYQETGEITCRLAEHWFKALEAEGILTHYIDCPTPTSMLVRPDIVPVEVIRRNYANRFAPATCRGELQSEGGVGRKIMSQSH